MDNALTRLFLLPSAKEVKARELKHAELELLKYEEAVEHDIAMRDMLKTRIARLKSPE